MKTNIIWFRRDLRLHDNCALYHALKDGRPVVPIFIFDTNILNTLESKIDPRVSFIYSALQKMQAELGRMSCSLEVYHGAPVEIFKALIRQHDIVQVFANHDYENYALERDLEIGILLRNSGIKFSTYKDHVIFEKDEVVKENGTPYTVFTPYSRRWLAKLSGFYLRSYPCEKYFTNFNKESVKPLPSLESIGFQQSKMIFPDKALNKSTLMDYEEVRDVPGKNATSRLGIHLRFGTLSIRDVGRTAQMFSPVFLKELIWRDFYQAICWHSANVRAGKAFKPDYDFIEWRNNEDEFNKWCKGITGYPIVDAGMRQLNETGFMHNRVRMIVSSFLSKHLLIDWRWGEAYFAMKLLDYEFASNNGGWQWAVGSGCDAAPYFRIFNPYLQTEKFDPQHIYIKQWVPDYKELTYPPVIVEHEFARNRCLSVYRKALN